MPSILRTNPTDVFLNVPYDRDFEPILIALTAALVALGRTPRLTFEIPDEGEGRLRKMVTLIRSCPVSFHDLSAVEPPPRWNMPFELGLACAIRELGRGVAKHKFFLLEKENYRLNQYLSDMKGIDHKVHRGAPAGAISAVLDVLNKPGYNANTSEVLTLFTEMQADVPAILAKYHADQLTDSKSAYATLVLLGLEKAESRGFLRP